MPTPDEERKQPVKLRRDLKAGGPGRAGPAAGSASPYAYPCSDVLHGPERIDWLPAPFLRPPHLAGTARPGQRGSPFAPRTGEPVRTGPPLM